MYEEHLIGEPMFTKIIISLMLLFVTIIKVYDKDYRLVGYIENNKIYDKNWNLKGYIEGDKVYDKNWKLKGRDNFQYRELLNRKGNK